MEQRSSLAYIKKKLTEAYIEKLANCHLTKTQKRKTSQQGFYISQVEKEIIKVLGYIAKKYSLRYI